jgi:hypothetical protein
MNPLDEIKFDTTNCVPYSESPGVRVWQTPAGDGVVLRLCPLPPDIGASLASLDQLRSYYRTLAESAGVGVIEVESRLLDRCPGVRTVMKVAQQPRGRSFFGTLTLPFRKFSYVIKIECEERGWTGARETVVFDRMLGTGEVVLDRDGAITGWADDPYDPDNRTPMVRNRGERPEYDVMFPDHPLSRARAMLGRIERTLQVSGRVRGQPPFVFPSK